MSFPPPRSAAPCEGAREAQVMHDRNHGASGRFEPVPEKSEKLLLVRQVEVLVGSSRSRSRGFCARHWRGRPAESRRRERRHAPPPQGGQPVCRSASSILESPWASPSRKLRRRRSARGDDFLHREGVAHGVALVEHGHAAGEFRRFHAGGDLASDGYETSYGIVRERARMSVVFPAPFGPRA
jgi:hypothetical protein